VPKCSSTQFLRSSHSRIASKTPPKSAWLTRTWTRAILEGRQPGGFTAQKLVTYPDCRSAGRSSAKRSASSGRATRTMRLPPHEGRISFATPLHHWPRETMRRFRRPQPSESGLSRECADRHRRQSPAHGGVFPNPSSLDINPCKIRNLGGRRCGIRPAVRLPKYTGPARCLTTRWDRRAGPNCERRDPTLGTLGSQFTSQNGTRSEFFR
jgi:hypothetical protein